MRYTFKSIPSDPKREEKLGALLTLSNGRVSVRGEFELLPSRYGTFVSGVYDHSPIFNRELVNLPRVVGALVSLNGEPVDLWSGVVQVERVLDVGRGVLESSLDWCSEVQGSCLRYRSVRLVHKGLKEIVAQLMSIQVYKGGGPVSLASLIDSTIATPQIPESVMIRHYEVVDFWAEGGRRVGITVKTSDGKYRVSFAQELVPLFSGFSAKTVRRPDRPGVVLLFEAGTGETYDVLLLTAVTRSHEGLDTRERALDALSRALEKGWESLVKSHSDLWREVWDSVRFRIEGGESFERALLFNTFHMLQLEDEEAEELIVGARGLHGLGYRGHVFWDTEIYALPFYAIMRPKTARKILKYRCNRLEKARMHARSLGFKGARFPWESADDGDESTPREIPLNLRWDRKVEIWTGYEEEHVTADIAYAVDYYYRATGDREFMRECGIPLVIETARYWASRVEEDPTRGLYVIKGVMGPDEYHPHVDNNFYTNVMARHNLRLASLYYREFSRDPELRGVLESMGVSGEEACEWESIAARIFIPESPYEGVFEQFEGYSRLEDKKKDPFCIGEGCVPEQVFERVEKTKLIKQADVVLALLLLEEEFSEDQLRRNFDYYIERTLHGSSLSLPAYAAAAAKLGYTDMAITLLEMAANADLMDIYGNAETGFHIGSSGGVWMALLHGILNVKPREGEVVIGPHKLPKPWRRVEIRTSKGVLIFQGDEA